MCSIGYLPSQTQSESCKNSLDDINSFRVHSVAIVKSQLEIAGYAAIGLGVLEILIVLFTTYLIFRGADGHRIRRAFTGNFAVAVAEPVAVRPGEQVRHSVPVQSEEFEVDMSTLGSRATTERRSKFQVQRMIGCNRLLIVVVI